MEPESPDQRNTNDQQKFDADVSRVGRRVVGVAAGLGIVAALVMSAVALTVKTSGTVTTVAAPARASAPASASVVIAHVLRGCHALGVNGAPASSPNATIRLAAGGTLNMENNDVMPHRLVLLSGGQAQMSGAGMNHLGATSSVTFPVPGTYTFTTKAGEDYTSGINTVGPDNVIRLQVVVSPAATA